MATPTLVILASGRGSNFEAVADAVQKKELDARILALVCDQPGAGVLQKSQARGIRTLCVPKAPGQSSEAHEQAWLAEVDRATGLTPEWLVLAGYMRILSASLMQKFELEGGVARIVNVHPSLLPAFPGRDSYRRAFEAKSKQTGVTVHLVTHEVDAGPICAQQSFDISTCKSAEEVEQKGLEIEHKLFPETLKWILARRFSLERTPARRLRVRPH